MGKIHIFGLFSFKYLLGIITACDFVL